MTCSLTTLRTRTLKLAPRQDSPRDAAQSWPGNSQAVMLLAQISGCPLGYAVADKKKWPEMTSISGGLGQRTAVYTGTITADGMCPTPGRLRCRLLVSYPSGLLLVGLVVVRHDRLCLACGWNDSARGVRPLLDCGRWRVRDRRRTQRRRRCPVFRERFWNVHRVSEALELNPRI